jgi:acetyl-CoA carboxylase carboxyltransferase component
MLDGFADKSYNSDISFMNNLYKQLECLTSDKRRYYNAKKRKDDWNCIPSVQLEQIPDKRNDAYAVREFLLDLQNLNCSETDKQIILGLATGEIVKQDIPTVLNWENKDDRKKLSRFMKKLADRLDFAV